ncbi:hypothetical protein FACS189476_11640 [Spirochaetia bacterium]|nr:hypothetical protein FACS189476_11640 [Spirochaetia bacterium]
MKTKKGFDPQQTPDGAEFVKKHEKQRVGYYSLPFKVKGPAIKEFPIPYNKKEYTVKVFRIPNGYAIQTFYGKRILSTYCKILDQTLDIDEEALITQTTEKERENTFFDLFELAKKDITSGMFDKHISRVTKKETI